MSKTPLDVLYACIARINPKTIPADVRWETPTGYLDGAVSGPYAPVLAYGEYAVAIDRHGRTILLIGHHEGNLVIFQRYSGIREGTVVYQAPQGLDMTRYGGSCGSLSVLQLTEIFKATIVAVEEAAPRMTVAKIAIGVGLAAGIVAGGVYFWKKLR